MSKPKPKPHGLANARESLSPHRRTVLASIESTYELRPEHVELVVAALRLLDQADRADGELDKIGSLFITTQKGPAEHPLSRTARSNRQAAATLLSRLGLCDVTGGA